jgi:DNA-binding MarR family transcriptional regulator
VNPVQNRSVTETQRIMDAIRRLVHGLRVYSRATEKQYGLTLAQLFVLQKLSDIAALSLNDLAERTVTHQSSVSVVVTRLVNSGLVRRTRSARDGRSRDIALTAKGRAVLRKAPPATQERMIAAIVALPAAERRRLAGLLETVVGRSGLGHAQPAMLTDSLDAPKRKRARRPRRGAQIGTQTTTAATDFTDKRR